MMNSLKSMLPTAYSRKTGASNSNIFFKFNPNI